MGRIRGETGTGFSLALAIHTLAFVLGAVLGGLWVQFLLTQGALSLDWFLPGYTRVLDAGLGTVSFPALLWDVGRWPLLAWLLGFTALGVWLLPLLFAARGFFLAFCVAGLAGTLQVGGLLLAAVVFGLNGLLSIPIFFAMGIQSWVAAGRIRGHLFVRRGDNSLYPPTFWAKTLLGLGGVFFCAFGEFCLFPSMIQGLISVIS